MTTKTIEKTIKTTETIYVSADGKEWENANDCKEWEKGVKCVAEASWKNVPKMQVNTCNCGIDYSNEDQEAYMIIPRNEADIISVINYIRISVPYGEECENRITTDDIGNPVLINFGYDRDYCDIYKPNDIVKNITTYFESTIKEIQEKE